MAVALSLLMLTTIALVLGGVYLLRRGGMRKQALLMFGLALVMAINVAIWTLPDADGNTLVSAAKD